MKTGWTENRLNNAIWIDHERLNGEPCLAGTCVPIKTRFDYLIGGETLEDFLEGFPTVSREQALKVLTLAREKLLKDT